MKSTLYSSNLRMVHQLHPKNLMVGEDDLVHDYLKAIEVNGRIGVLFSNKDYGCEWDYDFRNKRWYKIDNTQFGVNIVMYALTS